MKLIVSLPDEDVEFLDSYAEPYGLASRSAALQKAVGLLRGSELRGACEHAWSDWVDEDEAEVWDVASAESLN
jgi:Arc/MetJ-type ribon-helix-helix transcriptional regulator